MNEAFISVENIEKHTKEPGIHHASVEALDEEEVLEGIPNNNALVNIDISNLLDLQLESQQKLLY